MMSGSDKLCTIEDPADLRSELMRGGDMSCARCCARSDDPSKLCEPVKSPNVNLFCD